MSDYDLKKGLFFHTKYLFWSIRKSNVNEGVYDEKITIDFARVFSNAYWIF